MNKNIKLYNSVKVDLILSFKNIPLEYFDKNNYQTLIENFNKYFNQIYMNYIVGIIYFCKVINPDYEIEDFDIVNRFGFKIEDIICFIEKDDDDIWDIYSNSIDLEEIKRFPLLPWNYEIITRKISKITDIDFVKDNINQNWDLEKITDWFDKEFILQNSQKKWKWYLIKHLFNPIDLSIELKTIINNENEYFVFICENILILEFPLELVRIIRSFLI